MLVLGIETSCDETSAAVVNDGRQVLSNVTISSQKAFAKSGGVIPEAAARKQVECIVSIVQTALLEADVQMADLDCLAVTKGPGLLGSLLVGTTAARTLASVHSKPLIGVHHTLGHLSSVWLEPEAEPQFPCLALSASGGHTELWHRTSHTHGTLLGHTRDDAAGEAFDKGATMLGLPYPGGPAIAKAAEAGDAQAYPFPLPLHDEEGFDFSFSGLKTALKYTLQDLQTAEQTVDISHVAASYQHALCLHLLDRLQRAVQAHPAVQEIHLVGGVSANTHLRALIAEQLPSIALRHPTHISYCTDNAAMIAAAGFFLHEVVGAKAIVPFSTEPSVPLAAIA